MVKKSKVVLLTVIANNFSVLERQSKRIPAAKRYKIEKKVREHRRKQRKDAKNNKAKSKHSS